MTRLLFYLSGFKDEEAAAIVGTPPFALVMSLQCFTKAVLEMK
jgi:hypothetical protein